MPNGHSTAPSAPLAGAPGDPGARPLLTANTRRTKATRRQARAPPPVGTPTGSTRSVPTLPAPHRSAGRVPGARSTAPLGTPTGSTRGRTGAKRALHRSFGTPRPVRQQAPVRPVSMGGDGDPWAEAVGWDDQNPRWTSAGPGECGSLRALAADPRPSVAGARPPRVTRGVPVAPRPAARPAGFPRGPGRTTPGHATVVTAPAGRCTAGRSLDHRPLPASLSLAASGPGGPAALARLGGDGRRSAGPR